MIDVVSTRRRRQPTRRRILPRSWRMGPQVKDDNCGFMTNEKLLVTDELGNQVNPRFGTYDYDPLRR